jgi:hypothetical protein
VADEKSSEPANKIPVARLQAESQERLGYPSYVVAGALHGSTKKELTIDEAKSLVTKWLQKPVATATAEEA